MTSPMLLARTLFHLAVLLALPPLLLGVVNRTKAIAAGRKGPPLLQAYFDLAKLLRKGAVYSRTTSWVFRAGPIVGVAAVASAGLLLAMGGAPAAISFGGDFVLFAYLLGLARFFTALAALDTGSAFEGMGAAREVTFASLAEPALFLCLLVLARATGSLSLSGMLGPALPAAWGAHAGAALVLAALGVFVIALAENSRIPVDDPNTHLELTMIHEVMVLDHGGPDLAYILYGASLKLFLFSAIFSRIALGHSDDALASEALFLLGVVLFAVAVGVVESVMARFRMIRVPQFLVGASVLSGFALVLLLR